MNKNNIKYVKASELTFDPRKQMSKMFAEGWYKELKTLSKDKEKLTAAFEHMFLLEHFYLAVEHENIASMVALTPGKIVPIRLDKKIMRKHLGFFAGTIGHFSLTKFLINHTYPFDISKDVGSFEFVATATEFQGRGIAHDLMRYLMEKFDYRSYVLEVAQNNPAARSLYERKLGFVEFQSTKAPKISGIGHFLYLKKER